MTQQQLETIVKDAIFNGKECEWVEFKMNNANPEEIGSNISALSNGACLHDQSYGYIIFGVHNETKEILGTTINLSRATHKGQELLNWVTTQLSPEVNVQFFDTQILEKNVSIIRIKATTHMPVTFKDQAFVRQGSYTKKLNDHPEKERIIWRKCSPELYEYETVMTGLDEQGVISLIDYPGYFQLMKLPLPKNIDGIINKLSEEKIIVKEDGNWAITKVGSLLFARDFRSISSITRKAVRLVFYNGVGKTEIVSGKDWTGQYGYAIGFDRLIRFLEDQLPTIETIEGPLRQNKSPYSIIALREIIANAIVHQDFTIPGTSVMIEVFSNRIEVTNPGRPLIRPDRFVDHNPQSRNAVLAKLMYRMNICEEKGSGFDKVVYECEKNLLPAPQPMEADNYTRVTLFARKAFKDMDRDEKNRACYFHACLRFVNGEAMTNSSLRERFGLADHETQSAWKIIKDSLDAQLIKEQDQGSRKFARYVPYWAS